MPRWEVVKNGFLAFWVSGCKTMAWPIGRHAGAQFEDHVDDLLVTRLTGIVTWWSVPHGLLAMACPC